MPMAERRVVEDVSLSHPARRGALPGRPLGLRQDHDPAPDRRARAAAGRAHRDRWRGGRRARLRLPPERAPGRADVPGFRPVPASARAARTSPSACAGIDRRGRERRVARAARRRSTWRPTPRAIRTCSRAASSSAWRWPARWRPSRELMLLDEAFSSLDTTLRAQVREDADRAPARRRHAGPAGHPRRRGGGPGRRPDPRHAGRPDRAERHAGASSMRARPTRSSPASSAR